MTARAIKVVYISIALLLAGLFVARFGLPAVLRAYVITGIGNCQKMPLLCAVPEKELVNPPVDEECVAELYRYKLTGSEICLPKGYPLVRDEIESAFHKKGRVVARGPAIYIFYEKPGFFVNLFPQVRKQGIGSNYEFLSRMMHASLNSINSLTDAFFTIAKTIFIRDLGNQKTLRIIEFAFADKKGFIAYSLSKWENYFDCSIIDSRDYLITLYIKDKGARLDVDKVISIISTVKSSG